MKGISRKNVRLARFIQEHFELYGSFVMSYAHAYEHADGDNQVIMDLSFDLLDQKYELSETYKNSTGLDADRKE